MKQGRLGRHAGAVWWGREERRTQGGGFFAPLSCYCWIPVCKNVTTDVQGSVKLLLERLLEGLCKDRCELGEAHTVRVRLLSQDKELSRLAVLYSTRLM